MSRFFAYLYFVPRRTAIFFISIYQKTLSPDHSPMGKLMYPHGRCKFYPTCSCYGKEAIEKYGFIKGGIKTVHRILRCNPWNKGGMDPVE